MTSISVSEPILNIIEAEISKGILKAVEYICNEYDLDYNEVQRKIKDKVYCEVDIQTKGYKLTKSSKPVKELEHENRCEALSAGKFEGFRRCKWRRLCSDKRFCKLHQRLSDVGQLRYGTIDDLPHSKT